MRTPASFAALVTLMTVAGTSAAPIGPTPGSAAGVVANALPHQRSRSVVPVSDFKLPDHDVGNPVGTPSGKCGECGGDGTTISIEGVQPLKNDASNLAKDLPGKVQVPVDNGMAPLGDGVHIDTSLDVGKGKSQSLPPLDPQGHGNGSPDKVHGPDVDVHVDANIGDNKPQSPDSSSPHGNGSPDKVHGPDVDVHVDANVGDNKPQPQSPDSGSPHGNGSPDKTQVPEVVHVEASIGDNKPQQSPDSNHPQGKPDDCPDPSKDHHDAGLEVAATVGAPVEGGKKDLDKDATHLVGSTTDKLDDSGKKLDDTIKTGANLALDDTHKAEDKAHDVGKDVHIAAGVDVGSGDDALKNVGGPNKPKLSAVQEVVEGADHLVKDLDQSAITLGQGHKNEKPTEDCEDGVTVGSQHGNPSISTPVVRLSGSRV